MGLHEEKIHCHLMSHKKRSGYNGVQRIFRRGAKNKDEHEPIYVEDDFSGSDEEVFLTEDEDRYEPTNHNGVSPVSTKKNWRQLPLNEIQPLLLHLNPSERTNIIMPAGIFLRLASNANDYDVEFQFNAPFYNDMPIRVVVPKNGAVYDIPIIPPPDRGKPRSGEWCESFGVITTERLAGGIIEDRGDTLLVWRVFQHTPSKLTPFGAWEKKNKNHHSQSEVMIYTRTEYELLLQECVGIDAQTITIRAIPLHKKNYEKMAKSCLPLHIHIQCPIVVSGHQQASPAPSTTSQEEGVREQQALDHENYEIPVNDDSNNLITFNDLEEENFI